MTQRGKPSSSRGRFAGMNETCRVGFGGCHSGGTLGAKAKLAAEIEPKQLQQLSEAMQQGNEFRKWLVNSYNACAVTRERYAAYGVSFQGMDNAARNIQETLERGVHSEADRGSLAALVKTYLQLAGNLQHDSP